MQRELQKQVWVTAVFLTRCVRAYPPACMHACMHACVCVCVQGWSPGIVCYRQSFTSTPRLRSDRHRVFHRFLFCFFSFFLAHPLWKQIVLIKSRQRRRYQINQCLEIKIKSKQRTSEIRFITQCSVSVAGCCRLH